MPSRLITAKKKALEDRLSSLLEQHAAANDQLNAALGAADRVIVKKQIASLEAEIAEVEQQLEELGGATVSSGKKEDDAKGEGASDRAPSWLGTGQRWAVLVGVNEYEDEFNYGQLSVCVSDAEAISNGLINSGYNEQRIYLMTDQSDEIPERANIIARLKSVADATESEDLLMFYYSGHGDMQGDESYLVGRDGRRNSLEDTGVSLSRVEKIIQKAAARAKVIILDACHSGANIGGKGPRAMSQEFIKRVFEQAEGMAVLASCKQGELSYEWKDQHQSAFTHYLLEAIKGDADLDKKSFVTVQDVNRHVTNGVKLWATKRQLTQTPTLQYTVAGDIILADFRK